MKVQDYLVVEARLKDELRNLDRIEAKLADLGLYPSVRTTTLQGFALGDEVSGRIIGSYLQDVYNCFENMAKAVASSMGGSGLPQSPDWHVELLRQMSMPVRGIRPNLLSKDTWLMLDEYRRFRDVFRSIYGFVLDTGKAVGLLGRLPKALASLRSDVEQFMEEMSRSLDIPGPGPHNA